jgi:hypothetical protein
VQGDSIQGNMQSERRDRAARLEHDAAGAADNPPPGRGESLSASGWLSLLGLFLVTLIA